MKKMNNTMAALLVIIIASVLVVASIAVNSLQNSEAQMDIISPGVVPDLDVEEEAIVEAEGNATAATTTSEAATNETSTATAASSATNNNKNITGPIRFLAIQTAQSGTLSQINATTYTLELSNVSDKTILFSDRPDRIVTSQSTSDFIGNWSVGEGAEEDSFSVDAPNAVLVLDEEGGRQQQEIAIITLFNPTYDSEADTLSYDIIPENATSATITTTTETTTSLDLPSEFGQSTLVIDSLGVPHPCFDEEGNVYICPF
jgi:hypothetical protein